MDLNNYNKFIKEENEHEYLIIKNLKFNNKNFDDIKINLNIMIFKNFENNFKDFNNKLNLIKNLFLNYNSLKNEKLINENEKNNLILEGILNKFKLFKIYYFKFENIFNIILNFKIYNELYNKNLIKLINFFFPEIEEYLNFNNELILKNNLKEFLKLTIFELDKIIKNFKLNENNFFIENLIIIKLIEILK
jgi:hypothetical protein